MTNLFPRLVRETPDYVVIDKPRGMPSAPLLADESGTALNWVLERYPSGFAVCPDELASGRKRLERGLIHRLDTGTRGLVLIALTQNSCTYFLDLQQSGRLVKRYSALCVNTACRLPGGFPPFGRDGTVFQDGAEISSLFRFYGEGRKQVRPVTGGENGAAAVKKAGKRTYTTHIETIRRTDNDTLEVVCSLTQGFRHQVRCHLLWAGHPILGDRLYFPETTRAELELSAVSLEFPDYGTSEPLCVSL